MFRVFTGRTLYDWRRPGVAQIEMQDRGVSRSDQNATNGAVYHSEADPTAKRAKQAGGKNQTSIIEFITAGVQHKQTARRALPEPAARYPGLIY
jgi:hypothetical protein